MTASDVLARYSRFAIDTNVVIYLIEGHPAFRQLAVTVMEHIVSRGLRAVISEIGVAECLYGVGKPGRARHKQDYLTFFFDRGVVEIQPLTSKIIMSAATNGAILGLTLMDALHFEAARESGCNCFVTNDKGFQSFQGLDTIQLSSLSHG